MRRLIPAALAALALAAPADTLAVGDLHDHTGGRDSLDARGGAVAPSAAQRAAVERMDARASWNRFGAPRSLFRAGGWLAEGLPGDPAAAAREFVRRNAALYRLSEADVAALELLADHRLTGTDAHVVQFRQRVGGLPVAGGGLLSLGIVRGRVAYASASLGATGALQGAQRLSGQDAWLRAARDVGVKAGAVGVRDSRAGFGQLRVRGLPTLQQVRQVAVPTPRDGVRRAYEVNVVDNGRTPAAWTVLVDASSGAVLRRVDRLDSAADAPNFSYFENNPPLDGSGRDRRIVVCFPAGAAPPAGCTFDERMAGDATPAPWDTLAGAIPTTTTTGNNADTALSAVSPLTPGPDRAVKPVSTTREYAPPFANAWQQSSCDPANFAGVGTPAVGGTNANDVNAAIVSLFANHNNMHDWAYALGFTEPAFNMQVDNHGQGGTGGDPELGDAQGGALAGGYPSYTGRDNANQITLQDGIAPISNMYLWQPVAGAFYPPCVDGDFDMSVIGHEYTHAISNRMVGGPDDGLTSNTDGQARAMGESYSDLSAVEYLAEHGASPSDDENPFAVGAYVTGSKRKGIRNYGMNESPLNYSDVQGYDGSGTGSPHDDGEIWSAVNHDIRQALIAKYDGVAPASDAALQLACARGEKPAGQCPGNRRWIQLTFDSFLLMAPDVSMLDARDALLAADRMRFGATDHAELWSAFARRGMGQRAASADPTPGDDDADFGGTDNPQPVPSFESPLRMDEATVAFRPTEAEGGAPVTGELFVGDYEANVTPVADTDPRTPRGATVALVPGTYSFIARSNGRGAVRFTRTIEPGAGVDVAVAMPINRASRAAGATASGDGGNLTSLIDDTEETNWSAGAREPDVAGTQVTVALAGGEQLVDRVQVSAILRPVPEDDDQDDPGNQNRFTALRKFAIETCSGACKTAGDFRRVYTSPDDAFPGGVPRPLAPDMTLRGFDVPDARATHVRLVVLANQCTGNPLYSDDTLDNDPLSTSDCTQGNPPLTTRTDQDVRAAELQVFSRAPAVVVTGPGAGGSPPAGGGAPAPPRRAVCPSTAGFASAKAVPRGKGLDLRFARRVRNPVSVDVFQQSSGRRVLDNRLVKRFRNRTRSFRWGGRARGGRRLGTGQYFVRFRMSMSAGRTDVRRTSLKRSGRRFRTRPAFYRRASCGLLNSYKLSSSAFGGRTQRPLGIAFQVEQRATVRVEVRRRGRLVRRFRAKRRKADRTHRLRLSAAELRRGDHRVRLTATRGSRTVVAVLVARRL